MEVAILGRQTFKEIWLEIEKKNRLEIDFLPL